MLARIGEVEIWRILELEELFLTPEELWPEADGAAEAIAAKVPGALDPASGRVILPVQSFVLKTPEAVILVDTGVGKQKTNSTPEWHMRDGSRFAAGLEAAGASFDTVDYVVFTHLHPDHVGWNTLRQGDAFIPAFPNARYLMPPADIDMLERSGHPMWAESILPVLDAGLVDRVTAGHQIGPYISLLATPGHSPGHVAVEIQSGGQSAVLIGDALHSTAQCAHPDWHFVYDADPAQAARSRRALLQTLAETRSLAVGSHFRLPSIGRVHADGDAFTWENLA